MAKDAWGKLVQIRAESRDAVRHGLGAMSSLAAEDVQEFVVKPVGAKVAPKQKLDTRSRCT